LFSFIRTLTTWHCPRSSAAAARLLLIVGPPAVQQSIDICSAAAGLLLWAPAETDRQTDGRPTVA